MPPKSYEWLVTILKELERQILDAQENRKIVLKLY